MPWTCSQTEDRLLDAQEGTLSPAELGEWNEHLAACPACRSLAESVRQTVASLRQLEPVEPGPWLLTKIIGQTGGAAPQRKRPRFRLLEPITNPRFALGAVAVLITFSVLYHSFAVGAPASLAAMNPVELYRQADRHAHLVYARGVRFFSDLRVVYEIQSQFQPQSPDDSAPPPGKKGTSRSERLPARSLECRLGHARNFTLGDTHEMCHAS